MLPFFPIEQVYVPNISIHNHDFQVIFTFMCYIFITFFILGRDSLVFKREKYESNLYRNEIFVCPVKPNAKLLSKCHVNDIAVTPLNWCVYPPSMHTCSASAKSCSCTFISQ